MTFSNLYVRYQNAIAVIASAVTLEIHAFIALNFYNGGIYNHHVPWSSVVLNYMYFCFDDLPEEIS